MKNSISYIIVCFLVLILNYVLKIAGFANSISEALSFNKEIVEFATTYFMLSVALWLTFYLRNKKGRKTNY